MSEKEQPLGVCDLCLEQMPEDQWYTKEGKIRLHCSITCRNTANSRAGREIKRIKTLERMAAGKWQVPSKIRAPSSEAISQGVSRARKAEVKAGTWISPSKSEAARKKLSRPRVHVDNPILKEAISKLTRGISLTELTPQEREEHRKYRQKLYKNRSAKISAKYREKQAQMTDEEREAQRAKWREQGKRKREKKRKLRGPHSLKRLNEEQIAKLRTQRQQGDSIQKLMEDYNLSRSSVYRYLGPQVKSGQGK